MRKIHSKRLINSRIHCIECGELVTHEDDIGMWCDSECGRIKEMRRRKKIEKAMEAFQNFGAPKEEE